MCNSPAIKKGVLFDVRNVKILLNIAISCSDKVDGRKYSVLNNNK